MIGRCIFVQIKNFIFVVILKKMFIIFYLEKIMSCLLKKYIFKSITTLKVLDLQISSTNIRKFVKIGDLY